MAVMTEYLWYLARGSGLVTLILLTVVVTLGIAQRSGRPLGGLPRFGVAAVHRNASLLSVAFLVIHILTLLADPYAQLRLINLVVPFTASYRPMWTGLGAVALDLLAALVVTGLLRHRIGLRRFRAIHWLAYAAWPIALAHGIGSGTDRGQLWLVGTTVLCAMVVVGAALWRVSASFAQTSGVRIAAARIVAPPIGKE
jgi:sulfoxide reductase heme-binding subunit YedZ